MIHLIALGVLAIVGVMILAVVVGTIGLGFGLIFGIIGLAFRIAWIPFEILLGILKALLHI